jgi:hypothetical protein
MEFSDLSLDAAKLQRLLTTVLWQYASYRRPKSGVQCSLPVKGDPALQNRWECVDDAQMCSR